MIKRLRKLKSERKFSQFYSLFDQLFGERSDDESFLRWLVSKQLGMSLYGFRKSYEEWCNREFKDPRGRRKLSPEVIKEVYDTYIDNSISSTDGRNGRSTVKQSLSKFLQIYGQEMVHKDIKLEEKVKRNRTVYTANRRIATCTIRAIQKKLQEEGVQISIGKLLELKPFFIL